MSDDDEKQQQRRILVIRHGESEFNKLHSENKEELQLEENRYHPKLCETIDCSLTKLGQQQALGAGRELIDLYKYKSNDRNNKWVFLSSPLRRSLQTMQYIFESMHATSNNHHNPKDPHIGDEETSATAPATATAKETTRDKFLVHVDVCSVATEIMVDPCDIGTTKVELEKEFNDSNSNNTGSLICWNFDDIQQEPPQPNYWWFGNKSPNETLENMKQRKGLESEEFASKRILILKKYLRSIVATRETTTTTKINNYPDESGDNYYVKKNEQSITTAAAAATTTIVLVCHSEVIWWLTSSVKGDDGERFGTWTKNCEILDVTEHIFDKYMTE